MSFLPKFLGHLQYLKTTSDAKRNNIPFHQPTRFAAKTPHLLFCHPKTIAMTHMLKWHAVHRIPTITFFTHTKITILLSEVGNQPAADGSFMESVGIFTQLVLVKGRFGRETSVLLFLWSHQTSPILDVDHWLLRVLSFTRWAPDPVAKEPLWMAL